MKFGLIAGNGKFPFLVLEGARKAGADVAVPAIREETEQEIERLDLGQTIVIRDRACVAIEAMEGTDAVIRRAGGLVRGRLTVVKIAKPDQDMRFDVPVVGVPTIESMVDSGATCLCLTAGKTLMFDREETIKRANKNKIAIVA